MNYYLGINIGTSSTKSLLMDKDGNMIGTSQLGYDIIKNRADYAEQDMEALWKAVKHTLRDLAGRCTDW